MITCLIWPYINIPLEGHITYKTGFPVFLINRHLSIFTSEIVKVALNTITTTQLVKQFNYISLQWIVLGNIRDFCDSLILARKEAEQEENEEILNQLTNTHLIQTLSDIFGGTLS